MKIGIITAMPEESATLIKGVKDVDFKVVNKKRVFAYSKNGHAIQIIEGGMGVKNAAIASQMITLNKLDLLISIGLCGGISKELGVGDIVVGKYLRKLHLQPVPQWIQGIAYKNGYLYITADDGEADLNEPDNLYRVKVTDKSYAQVERVHTFNELDDKLHKMKKQGEIEGLAFDPKDKTLLVHFNRGTKIILGMPKGFYPGYTKEISEVYVYKIGATKK